MHPATDEDAAKRPQMRFLPWLPPVVITTLQRLLTTLAMVLLMLPMVTVKACNGPSRDFTGFEFFLSRSAHQVGFALMLVVVAVLVIAPWRPRVEERPARSMAELSHASLLAVGVGIVALVVGVAPVGGLFVSSTPLYGYPLVLGCWLLLYGMLVLSGLPRLVGLFAARPRWWTLLAIAMVPLVPPAKLIYMHELRLELFAACAAISAVVGIPLGLALVSSAEVLRRDGVSGRGLLGLSLALWASWIAVWSFGIGR